MTNDKHLPKEVSDLMDKGDMVRGDDPTLHISLLPFGMPLLDDILGGGIPAGRISIVYGDYSSLKTTLALKWIAHNQKNGKRALFVDAEYTYQQEWAEQLGVNTNDLIVSQPPTGEKAIDIIADVLPYFDMVVIDSLPALVPSVMLEESAEKAFIGAHARLITRGLLRLNAKNQKAAIMALNQTRTQIGFPGEQLPGGKVVRQVAMIMLRVSRADWIKDGNRRIGFICHAMTAKNKLAQPYQECNLPFHFQGLFDEIAVGIDWAITKGLFGGKAPFYVWQGEKYHGKPALRQHFLDDPTDFERLMAQGE